MTIASTNPATGETLKTFPPDSDAVIEQKLEKAASAAKQWRRTSFAERAQRMSRAAAILEQRKDRSEEHTSELQSRLHLVCRLLLEKKKKKRMTIESLIKQE